MPVYAGTNDPPLSGNLRDSATPPCAALLRRCGSKRLPAFQRSLPAAVLEPERFRGSVAPSAALAPDISRLAVTLSREGMD